MSSSFSQMFSCQIAIRPSCWFDDAGNVTWTMLCSTYVTSQSLNDLYTGVRRSVTNCPLPLVGSPCHCDNALWYGAYWCMGPRTLIPGRWVTALNASRMNSTSSELLPVTWCMMTLWHGIASRITALCEGNPWATSGFLPQRAKIRSFDDFLCLA